MAFYLQGFETSSTTMTFTLHELSLNQELQERARENVREVLARHNGKITYESLSEMTYLEQCINGSSPTSFTIPVQLLIDLLFQNLFENSHLERASFEQ